MKKETKEIYRCDHCNKLYLVKHACEKHELSCFKNPENKRPCFSCGFLTKNEALIYSGYDDINGNPVNKNVQFFYCSKKQKFLYTPKNEIKGNQFHTDENGDDFENISMPKDCDLFKNELIF
jgi:hypothetical protein